MDTNTTCQNVDGRSVKMDVDKILTDVVNPNGLWQWMVTLLLAFSTPSPATFPIYVHSNPQHRCRMEPPIEEFISSQNITFQTVATLIDPALSWRRYNDTKATDNLASPGCQRYRLSWGATDWMAYFVNNSSRLPVFNSSEICTNGYVFDRDTSHYPNTIIAEFGMLCDKSWLAPLGTSIYMVGMLCGFLIGGWSGDRFGRKRTLIMLSLLEIASSIGISVAPNFPVYAIFRALVAVGNTVKISVGSVLALEITLARYRSLYGGILSFFLDFVYRSAMATWAFLIPSWRWLHLVVMCPSLLTIFYFHALPESPRWLVSQRQYGQAMRVLNSGFRINNIFNKTKLHGDMLDLLQPETMVVEPSKPGKLINDISTKRRKYNCLPVVLSNWRSAKTTVLAAFVVFGIVMSFFGILLYAESVKGSVYLVGFYNTLTAIPAVVFGILLYRHFQSRKKPLMTVLGMASLFLTVSSLYCILCKPSTDLVLTVGSNMALMMINISICMIYVYIPELFPSDTRTSGFGIVFAFSRLGTVLGTYVNELDKLFVHGLPIIIYAATTVLVILLLLLLKDVNGAKLPDFTDDNLIEVKHIPGKHTV